MVEPHHSWRRVWALGALATELAAGAQALSVDATSNGAERQRFADIGHRTSDLLPS